MTGTLEIDWQLADPTVPLLYFLFFLLLKYSISQRFDRSSSSSPLPSLPPPPSDFDMNWQTILNQSEPTIHCRSNPLLHHLSTKACNSSSYRVSIGQEVVNITEIARHRHQPSTAGIMPMEQRRTDASRKGVNILSLCFMCFVSVSLILVAISTLHLLLKTPPTIHNDILRYPLNLSSALLSMYNVPETVVNVMVPVYDRTLRELAAVLCIFVVVLNCLSLLIFSLEIYLTCNMIKRYSETVPW